MGKLGRMEKKAVVAYFKRQSWHSSGRGEVKGKGKVVPVL
jgi:hypothetical protein